MTPSRLNDLTGSEWKFWSRSVITKPYPPDLQHALRREHGGQKPPRLCEDLIRVFSHEGDRVLDPLAGVGGTLLGATLAGRRAYGIERNGRWVEIYREVCRREKLDEQSCRVGDARQALADLEPESFQFVLTDLPYWDMDRLSKTRSRRAATSHLSSFGGQPAPAGEGSGAVGPSSRIGLASGGRGLRSRDFPVAAGQPAQSKDEWLSDMTEILLGSARALQPRRYLAVFIGDLYRGNEYHMLAAEVAFALRGSPLVLKANLIWYDVSKSLHVYGYPSAFVPSLTHQNILVFRKENSGTHDSFPERRKRVVCP